MLFLHVNNKPHDIMFTLPTDHSEMFKNPNPEQQRLMELIDSRIEDGMDRSDIEESLIGDLMDETSFHFCMSYALWKLGQKRQSESEYDEDLEKMLALDSVPEDKTGNETESESEPESSEPEDLSAREVLGRLNEMPGWNNLKRRMEGIISLHGVAEIRDALGLKKNLPTMHTILIGNPGTGKSCCVKYLAEIYHALGMLPENSIRLTNLAKVSNNTITSEIHYAIGGVLVFENAHELYHSENKPIDNEQQIVRSLIDELNDPAKQSNWMLVLTGEPQGMESLLAAYPELREHFQEPVYMEDFKPEELYRIVDRCCDERDVHLAPQAKKKLEMFLLHKYNQRGPNFENARFVQRLFDEKIIPAMYKRIADSEDPEVADDLGLVVAESIPSINGSSGDGMAELDDLIGLARIKTRVKDYLNAVRLASRRMELGLPTSMPRLHMAFLGNPGTGKTTVAEIIGKVFAEWGILSVGRVIRTEKSQMVGQYIGETEYKMNNLLARARGNILFIDEAYQLAEGGKSDFGRIVMNSLLTELGKNNLDMVVILAGYTAPMKKLLESNEGIESRFPNVFNFEDYTTDELLEIGKLMIHRQGFNLTEGAELNMQAIIRAESEKPSPRFGNGRFVSNLLQNEILATLGARTAKMDNPTAEDLSTILPEDVVVNKAQKDVIFDDVAIDEALKRLDSLAGLPNVKQAIHNFVQSARYLHSIGEPYVGKGLLSWRFIGKSGTGKSTVAEIMAEILKGMRLIANSHITEIKGERIFNVSESDCDAVLQEAVKKSCNGLIFIDVDDSKFDGTRSYYGRSVEQIRLKVKELTIESGGECALILAELDAPNKNVAEQLSDGGVYEFDHTLVFKDFTPDELFQILCGCLEKFLVSFSPAAERHIKGFLKSLNSSIGASARTMKLMSRTIYQQVILRESGLARPPKSHQVQLADIETFKWDSKKGKIGF